MDSDLASLIIGSIAGLIGFFTGQAAERRAYRLSATAFVSDYFRDLRAWASEAIDVLTEAAYCAPGRGETSAMDSDICVRCRHRLSALIDRGRFFIPNSAHESMGIEKPLAYRGIRHPALDLLVAGEQILSGHPELVEQFPSARAALVEVKRAFVSEIQEILDPRAQNRHLAEMLRITRGDSDDQRSALERLAAGEHQDFSRK